jgi:hypothetical protein
MRQLRDGRWVCQGGPSRQGHYGCDFSSPHYHEAVTHASANGANPPDMPRVMA